ncbi:MAG TPA: XdhC family protein [Bryocella sp.]|nr:XdhC family protein [Bryocella sp.]
MRERRSIVEQWQQGTAAALVTLVRVEGSSYRRPGARLLVSADGSSIGSISGGCLEAEVARKARWGVRNGAVLERLSTVFDDTDDMPYGLGCGGTLDLLIEPVDTPEAAALLSAMSESLTGLRRNVVTWLPTNGRSLRRAIYDESGTVIFESSGSPSNLSVFDECLEPPQRLLLFGAGDDAQPISQLASLMGWQTFIFDGRPQLARRDRFHAAEAIFAASEFTTIVPQPDDAVVIMCHSYEQDRSWLNSILPYQPRYIGLLGSRHRSSLLLSEAASTLRWTLDQACHNVFAPVGLDLGGDGAEAIALATIAEIQACRQGKLGHSRRMTPEIIAEQIARGGAARYLQAQCAL